MTNISTHGMIAKICCLGRVHRLRVELHRQPLRDADQDRQHADREEVRAA